MKSKAEVSNKFKRKKKRVVDKKTGTEVEEVFENKDEYMGNVSNWFETQKTFKLKHKIDSILHIPKFKGHSDLLAVFFNNNTFAIKQLVETEDNLSLKDFASFENLSHQAVVRSVSFNQDDSLVLSVSADCVKLWTTLKDFQAVRTVQIQDAIASCFLPFQKYALLATRGGNLALLNTDSGAVECVIEKAHSNIIWNIDWVVIDGDLIIATCSSDCLIKFWNLTEKVKSKAMGLEVIRSVQIAESLQWVRFNNTGKYYCCALMDNSMQVLVLD